MYYFVCVCLWFEILRQKSFFQHHQQKKYYCGPILPTQTYDYEKRQNINGSWNLWPGWIVVLSLLTRTQTHKYKNTYLVKDQTHTSENTKCSTVNSEPGRIVVLSLLTRTQTQKIQKHLPSQGANTHKWKHKILQSKFRAREDRGSKFTYKDTNTQIQKHLPSQGPNTHKWKHKMFHRKFRAREDRGSK